MGPLAAAALGWLVLGAAVLPALGAPPSSNKDGSRSEVLSRLNASIGKAMESARLTDQQSTSLGNARQVIGEIGSSRRNPNKDQRQRLKEAFDQVGKVLKSGAFGKEDKKAVQDDLKRAKDLGLTADNRNRGQGQGRSMGRDPFPRRDPTFGGRGLGGTQRRR